MKCTKAKKGDFGRLISLFPGDSRRSIATFCLSDGKSSGLKLENGWALLPEGR
jgi:hypothetical protein